ncbi:MAG: NIPSNAP family protein [Proteobacteria bacterium]|nr:NIPSNAP family protein [Pseudomonadota bacterium]
MLLDVRTYKIKVGCMGPHLELYGKLGYPVQVKHLGEPLCFAQAEAGDLNSIVHVWVYDSAADREQKRGRMAQDPDWKAYLAESAKAGYVLEQKNSLMTPTAFAPPIASRKV